MHYDNAFNQEMAGCKDFHHQKVLSQPTQTNGQLLIPQSEIPTILITEDQQPRMHLQGGYALT